MFLGTSGFSGEFMIIEGVMMSNRWLGISLGIGVILTGAYSLFLYNRVMFGNINIRSGKVVTEDMNLREISVILSDNNNNVSFRFMF